MKQGNKKIILGWLVVLILGVAGMFLHHYNAAVAEEFHPFAAAQPQEPEETAPDVAFIGDDFSLPDVNDYRPVYDKYTTKQRQDKGLPTSYGGKRAYYYGDHVVYLTFDDGPNEANTMKILSILKEEQIHATFFLVGQNVERYPDVVKAIYQSGNAIGIHSYSHDYKKVYASPEAYTHELLQTEELIYNAIGVRPIISRAPGGTSGHFTPAFWSALQQIGYLEVGWNALTGDADGTAKTPQQAVDNLRKQLQLRPYLNSHLVVLMHDASGHEATVEALPQIIKLLKDNGYTFRVVNSSVPPCW